jgi:nucleotide-binding universal stress UspA family protein
VRQKAAVRSYAADTPGPAARLPIRPAVTKATILTTAADTSGLRRSAWADRGWPGGPACHKGRAAGIGGQGARLGLRLITVTTATPPTGLVHLVVGYDGSPPARRALDAAVRLLQGRTGRIEVVYVAQLSSLAMLSPAAIAEMESDFDEIEQELRAAATEQLRESPAAWGFGRRQGIVPDELIAAAAAIGAADAGSDPGSTVAIVVGSSSHATHRIIGSAAVSLARHSPVPLVIVP